jgi:hypothetical protein
MNANWDVFSQVGGHYDTFRPSAPAVLSGLLTQMAQIDIPSLVVDVGSGTGLSTFIWAEQAKAVLGIEPSAARDRAELPALAAEQSAATLASERPFPLHQRAMAAPTRNGQCRAVHWTGADQRRGPRSSKRSAQRGRGRISLFYANCTRKHWQPPRPLVFLLSCKDWG